MTEKIKINVTKATLDTLMKDAESFELYKTDGRTLNKNALYTRIIVNYHETFRVKEAELFNYLKKTLSPALLPKCDPDALCFAITSHVNKLKASAGRDKFDCSLSIKPTKESEPVIAYVEEYLLSGATLSEYFRNLFSSYASLPQDEREKIVFKTQYDAIADAVSDKKKAFITTSGGAVKKFEISPFALSDSKEELHVYVLSVANGECMPLRLSRITSVNVLRDSAVFTDEQKRIFEKMLTYGPQFKYGKRETEVKVRLTPIGADLFKKLYVHRPVPTKIEDDCYYFECSYTQIIQYFVRFGRDAYVVYPEKVRDAIFFFHKNACNSYYATKRRQNKKNDPIGSDESD